MQLRDVFFAASLGLMSVALASPSPAETITPNTFDDPPLVGPGVGTDCSLRYAIQSVNTGAYEGGCQAASTGGTPGPGDTIALGEGDYLLTLAGGDEDGNATGDLDLINSVIIQGAGSTLTAIDASGIAGGDRILHLMIGRAPTETSLEGLTIRGGDVTGLSDDEGGGIFSEGNRLLLEDVRVTDNRANLGGGIAQFGFDIASEMLMNNSTVDGNFGEECGGGILLLLTAAGISNSTIDNNEATAGPGGGICQAGDLLFLTNSTISANRASQEGGGIVTFFDTTSGLKGSYNVTITLNDSGTVGGGISAFNQLTDNGAPADPFPTRIFNTIIAGNTAVRANDCADGNYQTGGFNLIGEIGPNDNCLDFVDGVNGDQVGTPEAPIDAMLGPLADNGGPTRTHALLEGSPAIDRGNPDGCEALDVPQYLETNTAVFNELTADQRGLVRPVAILDPSVPVCDIGAYELQVVEPTPTPTPTVTPVPPFNAFLEGSGCTLGGSAQATPGLAWMAGFAGMFLAGLRRRKK